MKYLHREDLFTWSEFNPERNIDFNSVLWARKDGNIIIDPVPLNPHDQDHIKELGGAKWIIITNSDHIRDAKKIREMTGAKLAGPLEEKETLPIQCDHYLSDGDELVPGLKTLELHGSKTPGELALVLEDTTLITGDLIRAHRPDNLMILPREKLTDFKKAKNSLCYLLDFKGIEAVLVGDGWPIFKDGYKYLKDLFDQLDN
ncbi:MAG: MBL fold metallo-hydrolase [Deltaproteobacteria bacterium]|nr:MAG: MBL fold metallo-hydrolase [Deltaproteobacteria bacterium]